MTGVETRPRDARLSRKVAERYASEGYEVLEEPGPHQLPEFLRPFRPDLIARKGNQHVVIEVKPSAEGELPALKAIAVEVAKHPDWRLDVVVGESPMPLRTQSIAELAAQYEEARTLLASHPNAGELLLWSVFEGVARNAAAKHGVSLSPGLTPQALSKSLAAHGFIEEEELDRLLVGARRRNALAHGFATAPDPNHSPFVAELVARLLRELVEGREQ